MGQKEKRSRSSKKDEEDRSFLSWKSLGTGEHLRRKEKRGGRGGPHNRVLFLIKNGAFQLFG